MKPFAILLSLALVSPTMRAADVNQLTWLTGCWSMQPAPNQKSSAISEERWAPPIGGQMQGIARTIQNSKVVFLEFMRIDTEKDGIYYTPRIGTSATLVRFKLTKQTDSEVVFENPAHDFPQRILYSKSPTGLNARIDGKEKGKQRAEDFPMKEVPCK